MVQGMKNNTKDTRDHVQVRSGNGFSDADPHSFSIPETRFVCNQDLPSPTRGMTLHRRGVGDAAGEYLRKSSTSNVASPVVFSSVPMAFPTLDAVY